MPAPNGNTHDNRVSTRSSNRGADKSITVSSRISRIFEKSVMANEEIEDNSAIARLGRLRLVIIQGCGMTRSEWTMEVGKKGDPKNQMRIGVCASPQVGLDILSRNGPSTQVPSTVTGVGRRGTARMIKQARQAAVAAGAVLMTSRICGWAFRLQGPKEGNPKSLLTRCSSKS